MGQIRELDRSGISDCGSELRVGTDQSLELLDRSGLSQFLVSGLEVLDHRGVGIGTLDFGIDE